MGEVPQPALRVALLAEENQRSGFRALLQAQGVDLVFDQKLDASLPQEWNGAEVALVSFRSETPRSRIDKFLDQLPLPAVLNAGGVGDSEAWNRGLVAKLGLLARGGTPAGGRRELRGRPGQRRRHTGDRSRRERLRPPR